MKQKNKTSAILLIHCQDAPGIVVAITDFIHNNGGNILYLPLDGAAGSGAANIMPPIKTPDNSRADTQERSTDSRKPGREGRR